MSRASTERDNMMNTMCEAAMNGTFTAVEVRVMFMTALEHLPKCEMEALLKRTQYQDLDDLEFAMEYK